MARRNPHVPVSRDHVADDTHPHHADQPVTDISVYVDALAVRFRPALSPADTTHWFSTEEVVSAIRQIDPSAKVDATQVFQALRNAGYDFCNRPSAQGLAFRWMFHEKPARP